LNEADICCIEACSSGDGGGHIDYSKHIKMTDNSYYCKYHI